MSLVKTTKKPEQNTEVPAQSGKKEMVRQMFNNIAPRYDFLNHFLSFGIDHLWRRKAMRIILRWPHQAILDVASGTGDMSILAAKSDAETIVGIDISEEMLEIQQRKIEERNLTGKIRLQVADAENLPFEAENFQIVMTAFGIRNFENTRKGISEFHRVLANGGHLVILEFSKPDVFFVKQVFRFYFSTVLPFLGKLVSKHKFAYTYLPDSVDNFPSGAGFVNLLADAGFVETTHTKLTFGIASIYTGKK